MAARKGSPYRAAFTAPTPETARNASSVTGALQAMSRREALENTT